MTQQLIVILIGIAVFSYAGFRLYKTLTGKDSDGSCGGCNSCS